MRGLVWAVDLDVTVSFTSVVIPSRLVGLPAAMIDGAIAVWEAADDLIAGAVAVVVGIIAA